MIVGVDVGGTFTDIVAVDPGRASQRFHKLRSTPEDPSRAVVQGLSELGLDPTRIARLVHGTTVATNAIIERRGATTGFLTTEGHRDIPEIRRGNKPESEVFNLLWDEPEPLVPRHLRCDVAGRLDAYGAEVEPLALDEVEAAVDHLVAQGAESLAICFLFSYLDPAHELAAAEVARARHPGLWLSLSSDVLPQWREYERASTTIADAYVKPVMAGYLGHLADSLAAGGVVGEPLIMRSNGGVMTASTARARPVDTFLSGPAGGVVAASVHGVRMGRPDVISIDVGGTSSDVALVTGGAPGITTQGWLDATTPLNLPMLDIRTIGAGGGSIAWVDAGGGLKVGPQSAGASPGPACYGQGGLHPTVTDANVVLGRIGARSLLGGALEIDPDLARVALERDVCAPLGLDLFQAAAGVIRICVSNMAKEIRALTAERGVNPRDYSLLAGGGAGPLHAALLAEEFEIAEVIVPAHPGLLSAGGLILSDLRVDRVRSYPIRLERMGAGGLGVVAGEMLAEVVRELRNEGYDGEPETELSFDMKYVGQNWDIRVPAPPLPLTVEAVAGAFDAEHERLYGFALAGHQHEVLAVRASAVGRTPGIEELVPRRAPAADGYRGEVGTRVAYDDRAGQLVDAALLVWEAMPAGYAAVGPAIVEGLDATVWVPTGWRALLDAEGNFALTLDNDDYRL
ncbi:MAG: hydantoinase/oxoprolinase family protein [Gaiellales bacterium]